LLFNSYQFIFIFLPIMFLIYFYLNSKRFTTVAKVFLLLGSLFFYSWWNINYLPLILLSIVFNYLLSDALVTKKEPKNIFLSKKSILIFGISCNLLLLAYFKYADFFITNFNLVLPLAISFFTFQQITYLVDSYRGEIEERNFLNYALFVSFFPQLIAGPIVYYRELVPQLSSLKLKVKNYRHIELGLFIF